MQFGVHTAPAVSLMLFETYLAFIYREALSSFVRDIRVWWMEEITSKRPHGKVFPACYKW